MLHRQFDEGPWITHPWDGNPATLPAAWARAAAGDGMSLTEDETARLRAAHRLITGYRGDNLSPAATAFVRSTARDVLFAAPHPLSAPWVRVTLTVVGGLTRMCEREGIPITRSDVFTERNQNRYLHVVCAGHATMARAGYRSRLDVVTAALSGTVLTYNLTRPAIHSLNVLVPYTDLSIVDMLAWCGGLRPPSRRSRAEATILLGLGIGARRRDAAVLTGTDFTRISDGTVQVDVRGISPRRVTVLARFEDDLWNAAQHAGPNLLVAPKASSLSENRYQQALNQINELSPPVPIMLRRLRNTWLSWHLAAGTPLPVLLPAAGLAGIQHLYDLLQHMPAPDPDAATTALRRNPA